MNFIKVSCLIVQAQCLTNWGDCRRSGYVIIHIQKTVGSQLNGMESSKLGLWKGYHLSI